ncbi:MAG: hypothetical protein WC527_00910 [Candidatus Margulisiibacteriota bacterium]
MKKFLAILLSVSLVACLSASSFSAVKKVVKKKPVVKKKVVKVAPKKVVPVKPAIETPWIPPTPAPIAPAPAPKPVSSAGMGMTVGAKVGLTAGLFAVTGDLDYSLASILPGAKARLSVDYVTGNNPKSTATIDNPMKSVDVKLGGTYALDMLKNAALPVDWYLGAAYIIPVKVDAGRTGKWGAEAYLGGTYKVPDFGTVYGELGYAGLKYAANAAALRGMNLAVGYAYSF